MKTKLCNKCDRELPADTNHFHRHKECKYGLRNTCKECRGTTFGVMFPNKVWDAKEGYQFCGTCHKELPATTYYFYQSKTIGDGLGYRCKVCWGGQYGIKHVNVVNQTKDGHKICSYCRKEKPYKEFYKTKDNSDGHSVRCKTCQENARADAFINNPGYHEKQKQRAKEYRVKYYSTPHGKYINKINCQKRRSRKKDTETRYNHKEWEKTIQYFDSKCAYCNENSELTQDHFFPLSLGGGYTVNNILPACLNCNMSKGVKPFFEWYPEQDFYSKSQEKKILKFLNYKKDGTQQLSITL